MEHIGLTMESVMQEAIRLRDEAKENASKNSQKKQEKLDATSECPLCGGSRHIYNKKENGYTICKCIELGILENKLKFADIPDEFKDLQVNDFNTEIYDGDDNKRLARVAKKIAVNYVKNFESISKKGKGLYFYSSSKGSGKTRLMVSLGNELIKVHMKSVKFITTNNLLDEIKNTFNNDTYSKLIEDIKRVDILILDDLGAERPTEWVNEIFYNILNDRMVLKK